MKDGPSTWWSWTLFQSSAVIWVSVLVLGCGPGPGHRECWHQSFLVALSPTEQVEMMVEHIHSNWQVSSANQCRRRETERETLLSLSPYSVHDIMSSGVSASSSPETFKTSLPTCSPLEAVECYQNHSLYICSLLVSLLDWWIQTNATCCGESFPLTQAQNVRVSWWSASVSEVCSSAALWSRHRSQQSTSVTVVSDTEGVSGGGSVWWAQLWQHREDDVCLSLTCLSLSLICLFLSLSSVSLDFADSGSVSGIQAVGVEMCECPWGYSGTSCEVSNLLLRYCQCWWRSW